MKIDFVKTLEASSPYTPGRIYFEESTSLIKVATANNQYRVFGGVRSADYDATTQTLTIQNGNGDEVYLDMSEYVKQDSIIYNGNAKIFYGTCSSGGSDTAKVVVCEDFTSSELVKGALIFVTFDASNSGAVASLTLNVNSTGAKSIKKQGNKSSTNNLTDAGEIRANSTYLFQYDGTNWVCMTLDYNSTYSALSEADMQAGTATTGRTISAARVKQAVEYWMTQNQADWDSSDNTSPSYILNKPTIPSTLDQIADGSTRKLSDYLPLAGGYMSSIDSSIFFGQDGYGFTKISYGGITVRNGGYFDGNQIEMKDPNADGGVGGIYVTEYNLHGYFKNYDYTFPLKAGTVALTSDIPTDSSVAAWGYLKVNDVSTKVDKSNAVSSLSLGMNSSTYTITLSGTMADGSTFTVGDPIDLPLETMVVDGSYNSSTKKVSLGLKNGSSVEFSVADLVAGLQTEITSSNKLSADLIQDGTTNKVVTATDKNKWNSLVSNVQADWNATTGLGVILNKPTIPAAVTESTVSGWGFTKNTGTLTGLRVNGIDASITNGIASVEDKVVVNIADNVTTYSVSEILNFRNQGKDIYIRYNSLDLPAVYFDSNGDFIIYAITVSADASLESNMPPAVLSIVQRGNSYTWTERDFNSAAFDGAYSKVYTIDVSTSINNIFNDSFNLNTLISSSTMDSIYDNICHNIRPIIRLSCLENVDMGNGVFDFPYIGGQAIEEWWYLCFGGSHGDLNGSGDKFKFIYIIYTPTTKTYNITIQFKELQYLKPYQLITSWHSSPSDTSIPSEKLVYDTIQSIRQLPAVTSSDQGYFLSVNSSGNWTKTTMIQALSDGLNLAYNGTFGTPGSLGNTLIGTGGIVKYGFTDWSWLKYRVLVSNNNYNTYNLQEFVNKRAADSYLGTFAMVRNSSTNTYYWADSRDVLQYESGALTVGYGLNFIVRGTFGNVFITTTGIEKTAYSDWSWITKTWWDNNGTYSMDLQTYLDETIPTDTSISAMGYIKNHATHKLNIGSATATAASSNTITYVESLTGTTTATSGNLTVTPTLKTITIPTVNNGTLTIQKNGTNINTFTANSSSNVTANIQVNELPTVTASDNGKILRVVSGVWSLVNPNVIYSGSGTPSNSMGNDGDIYLQS